MWWLLAVVSAAGVALAHPGSARADAEQDLAARYAPVVRLVVQHKPCGPGEPYQPTDINALLGKDTVALRGPFQQNDLIKVGPTASDLGRGLFGYHLDFPGNALRPGCTYEQWARMITQGTKPTVYSHIATEADYPGRLALQYWIFYPFNDWNNPHEGDWEMIQLLFDAATPTQALGRSPTEVGYSQHEGAERATWGESKLELVDGTHPVVYPAAGSHANYYQEELFLGASASEGVGCDDTRGPTFDVRPVVDTIPSDPAAARAEYPWIAFQGRWGELQKAFFNGPTGPNLKEQWTHPITWATSWRDRAYAVPGGGVLGTRATHFFCGAVAGVSKSLVFLVHSPGLFSLAIIALLALVAFTISRSRWRPSAPFRLERRRAWGQVLAASSRMYVRQSSLFLGIGLLFIPISLFVTLLQTGVLHAASIADIQTEGEGGGVLFLLVAAIGTALTLLGLGFVQAATSRALVELNCGRPISLFGAYRLASRHAWPLVGGVLIVSIAVSFLLSTLFLLPIAVWLAVRWALLVPALELEDLTCVRALRRSRELVRGGWLKVASLIVVGGALALVVGPLIGGLLILATDARLWVLDVIAGVVYALTMPFVALTATYVYFDARVRHELAAEREPDELPAEAELSL